MLGLRVVVHLSLHRFATHAVSMCQCLSVSWVNGTWCRLSNTKVRFCAGVKSGGVSETTHVHNALCHKTPWAWEVAHVPMCPRQEVQGL